MNHMQVYFCFLNTRFPMPMELYIASSGYVGELIKASVVRSAGISLTTNTVANVTSISLTPGDWDVTGMVGYQPSSATFTQLDAAITITSATLTPSTDNLCVQNTSGEIWIEGAGVSGTSADASIMIPKVRISLASTTTYYLTSRAIFGGGTAKTYGSIVARRVR